MHPDEIEEALRKFAAGGRWAGTNRRRLTLPNGPGLGGLLSAFEDPNTEMTYYGQQTDDGYDLENQINKSEKQREFQNEHTDVFVWLCLSPFLFVGGGLYDGLFCGLTLLLLFRIIWWGCACWCQAQYGAPKRGLNKFCC